MQHILVTGANRGIGLELVHQFLRRADTMIFAACRDPHNADALNGFQQSYPDRIVVVQLDVSDSASIAQSQQHVREHTNKLDILINNAGINPPRSEQTLEHISPETMLRTIRVNTLGPLFVTRAYLDLLKAADHARIMMVSSQLGSLTNRKSGGIYAYCSSKAALNMVTRGLAADLSPYGTTVVTIHPGWVRTDMGGSSATLSIQESAVAVLKIIDQINLEDSGRFINYDGGTHPW